MSAAVESGSYNYTWMFSFERNFDPNISTRWMQKNWMHGITYCAIYLLAVFGGQRFMRRRKEWNLKWSLVAWNLFIALFSIIGTVRMAPDFLAAWINKGFHHTICVSDFTETVPGFWCQMFAFSKVIEFIDTLFLVLRKRPVIFLHWYHHITVLLYTWHGFKDHTAAGRWFIMMNYTVHSFMYLYYGLRAMGYRFPKWLPMSITTLQISQMVVGLIVAISVYSTKRQGIPCRQSYNNLYLGFLMYLSYFCLFAHFFFKAYFTTRRHESDSVHSKATKQSKEPPASLEMKGHDHESNGLASNGSISKSCENGHMPDEALRRRKIQQS